MPSKETHTVWGPIRREIARRLGVSKSISTDFWDNAPPD